MKSSPANSVGSGLTSARKSSPRRRKPQRLPDFDYTNDGAYFVTMCVKGGLPLLGKVVGENTQLSRAGEIAKQVWFGLPQHYTSIKLDEFIVMPNHVHGIIWILSETSPLRSVGEGLRPSPTVPNKQYGLPEIIRAFKSFSAREINKTRNSPGAFWQRGFIEHVIRNDDDLYKHRAYIQNNPLKWSLDQYYQ